MAVIIRGPGREPGSLEEAGHWQPAVWPPCQASRPAPTSQEPSCQWKLRLALRRRCLAMAGLPRM